RDQCLVYVAEAAESGAQVVYGGRAPAQDGYFLEPTLVTVDDSRLRLVQEEIFGPVLALLTYRSLSEAMEAVNQVPYGLSAAIYSRDLLETQLFIQRAAVGMVHVNNPTIGGEAQMPFGGMKGSGLGPREMGHEGTLFFTETKTVFLDYSGQPRTSRIY
ncbi:MAG: aldehyde dehydrogenase family protein, partial [Sulfobacillus sp.]|nr:aldehyde dehydrogenase family protein [Sulfobacillus sp.]